MEHSAEFEPLPSPTTQSLSRTVRGESELAYYGLLENDPGSNQPYLQDFFFHEPHYEQKMIEISFDAKKLRLLKGATKFFVRISHDSKKDAWLVGLGKPGNMVCTATTAYKALTGYHKDTVFLASRATNYTAHLLHDVWGKKPYQLTVMSLMPIAYGGIHWARAMVPFATRQEAFLWTLSCYIPMAVAGMIGIIGILSYQMHKLNRKFFSQSRFSAKA
ncbi:hypothetical protein B0J14DRAFT_564757 [Halenospora varia]|nr:hypothetical protein B0J14DRAFT_564757 [Halenospora varia]